MISLIIIGNEILSAQIRDTNLTHMLTHLNRAGYKVDEVAMVRDEEDDIAATIVRLSARSRFVISTGGIGPTHDDVTLQAYARAFEAELIEHPEMLARVRDFFGDDRIAARRRLALVPANAELIATSHSSWPIIKVANCFVLPGLPAIFVKKFRGVLEALPPVEQRLFAALFTRSGETDFAEELTEIQGRFSAVEIGSYPTFGQADYAAQITLKGTAADAVAGAFEQLRALFERMDSLVAVREPAVYDPGSS